MVTFNLSSLVLYQKRKQGRFSLLQVLLILPRFSSRFSLSSSTQM